MKEVGMGAACTSSSGRPLCFERVFQWWEAADTPAAVARSLKWLGILPPLLLRHPTRGGPRGGIRKLKERHTFANALRKWRYDEDFTTCRQSTTHHHNCAMQLLRKGDEPLLARRARPALTGEDDYDSPSSDEDEEED
ncbi:hypothetical protein PPROV_000441000 [Pycnococcus provasolii]|uniref:Uncharacterized protein n=1 Tax=Pycnococcus provasolii TaxID=41880 RepID=A0A830HIL9_9CHLO|nr:hypothetical protein PPROV_000441000 [Pycnococcus provasolii]